MQQDALNTALLQDWDTRHGAESDAERLDSIANNLRWSVTRYGYSWTAVQYLTDIEMTEEYTTTGTLSCDTSGSVNYWNSEVTSSATSGTPFSILSVESSTRVYITKDGAATLAKKIVSLWSRTQVADWTAVRMAGQLRKETAFRLKEY